MSGLGISYPPPTENVPLFDASNFITDNSPITATTGLKYFLSYPYAQGTQTLQTTFVAGDLTCESDLIVNKNNIIMNPDVSPNPTNYIEFPDGSKQYVASTGGSAILPTNNTWTGTNTFNNTITAGIDDNIVMSAGTGYIQFPDGKQQTSAFTGFQPAGSTSYTNTNLTLDTNGKITAISNGSSGATPILSAVLTAGNSTLANQNIIMTAGTGYIEFPDGKQQTSAFTGFQPAVSTGYTNADITLDTNGKITAISNGSSGTNLLPTNNIWTGTNTTESYWVYQDGITTANNSKIDQDGIDLRITNNTIASGMIKFDASISGQPPSTIFQINSNGTGDSIFSKNLYIEDSVLVLRDNGAPTTQTNITQTANVLQFSNLATASSTPQITFVEYLVDADPVAVPPVVASFITPLTIKNTGITLAGASPITFPDTTIQQTAYIPPTTTANTYNYPSAIQINNKGQVLSITSGSAPTETTYTQVFVGNYSAGLNITIPTGVVKFDIVIIGTGGLSSPYFVGVPDGSHYDYYFQIPSTGGGAQVSKSVSSVSIPKQGTYLNNALQVYTGFTGVSSPKTTTIILNGVNLGEASDGNNASSFTTPGTATTTNPYTNSSYASWIVYQGDAGQPYGESYSSPNNGQLGGGNRYGGIGGYGQAGSVQNQYGQGQLYGALGGPSYGFPVYSATPINYGGCIITWYIQ
jgi:hypothetical protein